MLRMLGTTWWVLLIRGIAAILFGVLAFIWPGVTIATLVLLFGAYALVDGVFGLFAAFGARSYESNWWMLALGAVASIIFGLLVFFWPGITALVLLYMIASWAIITGIVEIVAAIQLRKEITGEFWLILAGILSVIFGIYVFIFPGAGALGLIWAIGAYAIVLGIALIMLSFRVRNLGQRLTST
ncbi:MAG: hypothetical protein DCC57_09315 [Chloroflexi bacterium]|nr:MAG: hypothetical protein DCC57_09315 [Chloroflexota bacterium]